MPTKYPRVNVVFDPPLHAVLRKLARREGTSLSTEVRRLVQEALELEEDLTLARWASAREKTFSRRSALTHDQVWGRTRNN